MLIGLLFFAPLLGAAVGGGAGALSGRFSDIGMDDRVAKQFKDELICVDCHLRRVTADKVLDGLKQFAGKGRVFQTSLSKDDDNSLREGLESPEKTKVA